MLGQPAEHRLARRQAGRHIGEAEARDLLDDVDLASDVTSAPGGNRHVLAVDAEPQPPQDRVLFVGRGLDADHGVGSLRAEAHHRRLRQLGMDVGVADPARSRMSSTMSCVASFAACSARYGSTPFSQRFEPSVRSRKRSAVRKVVYGSKFAASSRISVVSAPISVSSPPMIPASATERSPSAIIRS